MKLGVLYPRSKVYPDITTDFTNGLKSFLKREQLIDVVELTLEGVGYGGAEKEVYEKIEKLLLIDEVDMVAAYIDEKVIGILQPLLQSTGKLLLVLNSGANYPESWDAQPNLVRLGLNDAFLCYLAGKKPKDTALVATSFYECGYLHLAAMVNAFNHGGGNIVFNYVNKQQLDEVFQVNELADYLRSPGAAHNLLSVLGSKSAAAYYELLNGFENADQLHLYVSPMMLEPEALANATTGYKFSIEGYSPWMASAENDANRDMMDSFRTHSKKEASFFTLLGWETGMIVKEIYTNCKDQYADGAAVANTLKEITLNSPRGELKLDPATHYFLAPFHQYSLKNNTRQPVIETIAFPTDAWKEYTQYPIGGVHSGWTNTYLCY